MDSFESSLQQMWSAQPWNLDDNVSGMPIEEIVNVLNQFLTTESQPAVEYIEKGPSYQKKLRWNYENVNLRHRDSLEQQAFVQLPQISTRHIVVERLKQFTDSADDGDAPEQKESANQFDCSSEPKNVISTRFQTEAPELWKKIQENNFVKKGAFKCSHCGEPFRKLYDFIDHLDTFNLHKERKHFCIKSCVWGYIGFIRNAELIRHQLTVHKKRADCTPRARTSNNRFTAIRAGSRFTKDPNTELFETIDTTFHSGYREKRFDNFEFENDKSNVKYVTKLVPIRTKDGGYDETTMVELKYKILVLYDKFDEIVTFQCNTCPEECQKKFARKDSMTRHIESCHYNPNSRFHKNLRKKNAAALAEAASF